MPDARPPARSRYIVAVAAVLVATLARAALDEVIGGPGKLPFVTYYVAVVIVGLYGSFKSALFATLLAALTGTFLFVEPQYSLMVSASADALRIALFIVAGAIVAALADRIHRTRRRLREAAEFETQQAEAIQAQRKRLQDISQSIPGVVWEAWGEPDSNLQRIDYVSDYVETMVGYTPEEWTSQPNFWLELVHPEDREQAARVASEKFLSGGSGENEFRWITKDGRTVWVLARSSTIKDEHGTPIGMRGVTFDITHRKEVERRLALLAEISTTGLMTVPFDELARYIAQRSAAVIGDYCIVRMLCDGRLESVAWAHVEADAEPIVREIASQSDVIGVNSLYAEIVRSPRTMIENNLPEEAFAHVRRGGMEPLFQRFRARQGVFTPILSEGKLVGTLAIGRSAGPPYTEDDAKLMEAIASRASLAFENSRLFDAAQRDAEEARLARAEAEEAGRVKDEFLATLSHELRTPLNAILGWAHMLRDPQLPAERRQAAIETILRNAQSQEQLIADILDVQRIMAGKIRLNVRTVDLSNVVRAAADTVRPSAEAKDVRLQLLVDLDVPTISGDPDRLQQVAWNLLSNAIKFAPQGGHVQVRLLRSTDDFCELVVEDNGPGINPEFIPHMFERFRQADSSTTRTHKGLGLGLAIVRSLVEMHGGAITAANTATPGATGAVFTIRLPRQAAQPASGESSVDAESTWAGDIPSLAGVRVLVVDDDGDARDLLCTILQRGGASVTTTASVSEAIAAFDANRPDVIVSDIEMPEEDGYSLIRRIRKRGPGAGGSVPAAALTAYASASDRMKVLGAGFNIHVAKPVQPAELSIVVASLAGRRR